MDQNIIPYSGFSIERTMVADAGVVEKDVPVQRIFIGDNSGSMYGSIKALSESLKKTIRETTRVGDSVTVIWFSSQAGFVIRGFNVQDSDDLDRLDGRIESEFRARGMTSFNPALVLAKQVIDEDVAGNGESAVALTFMSDGHDNCNSRQSIYDLVESIAPLVDRAVVVEYGWYADTSTLHAMADRLNATYVFAEQVDRLIEVLDEEISAPVKSVPLVQVDSSAKLLVDPDTMRVFRVDEEGIAWVPMNVREVFGVINADEKPRTAPKGQDARILYALLAVHVQRDDVDITEKLLNTIGDKGLYRRYVNAFSKQDFVVIAEEAQAASADSSKRFLSGYGKNLVPDQDAPCVMDVLQTLSEGDNLINLADLNYRRVGRRTLSAKDVKAKEIAEIQQQIALATDQDALAPLFRKLATLASDAVEGLTFVDTDHKVPLADLTFSSSRPNVSILARIAGKVLVSPAKAHALGIPEVIESQRWRNFTIIADGIVNVPMLPVIVDKATFEKLQGLGVVKGRWSAGKQFNIELGDLPVINRRMVSSQKADVFVSDEISNLDVKAHAKVVNWLLDKTRKELGLGDSHRSQGLSERFGHEAAEWLKANGLTDSGYSPRSLVAPATEEINSHEVKVSVKGLSSLPKVEDVIAAIAKGKADQPKFRMMAEEVRAHDLDGMTEKEKMAYLPVLEATAAKYKALSRKLNRESAISRFTLIVGRTWFYDRDDREAFTISENGYDVTVALKDTVIKI